MIYKARPFVSHYLFTTYSRVNIFGLPFQGLKWLAIICTEKKHLLKYFFEAYKKELETENKGQAVPVQTGLDVTKSYEKK